MSKKKVEPEGSQITSKWGTYALRAGPARLHASTRMHTPMHPGTRTHENALTKIFNIYRLFTAIMIRERASVLRYMYIACFVNFNIYRSFEK